MQIKKVNYKKVDLLFQQSAKGYQLRAERPFEPFHEKKKIIGNWVAQ